MRVNSIRRASGATGIE
jgi:hypothetical protein